MPTHPQADPPAETKAMRRWRIFRRTLYPVATVAGVGWLMLLGWDLSSTLSGVGALPSVVQDTGLAATAVLALGVMVDLVASAVLTVLRWRLDRLAANLAEVRAELAGLRGTPAALDRIADTLADLGERVGERIDRAYLTGSQEALDAVDVRPPSRVVPMAGRAPAPRRTS